MIKHTPSHPILPDGTPHQVRVLVYLMQFFGFPTLVCAVLFYAVYHIGNELVASHAEFLHSVARATTEASESVRLLQRGVQTLTEAQERISHNQDRVVAVLEQQASLLRRIVPNTTPSSAYSEKAPATPPPPLGGDMN